METFVGIDRLKTFSTALTPDPSFLMGDGIDENGNARQGKDPQLEVSSDL